MDPLELNDVGFVVVKINGVEQKLDAYLVNNRLYAIGQECRDKPATEYHNRVQALLQELGYPPVSHALCDSFVRGITARVADLAKKN